MYAPDTIFVRNDKLPSGEVDGELVALDMEKGDCFGLDKIGTEIWHLAGEPVSLAAIIAALTDRYDVSESKCRADIIPFLEDMIASGLLRIAS